MPAPLPGLKQSITSYSQQTWRLGPGCRPDSRVPAAPIYLHGIHACACSARDTTRAAPADT